MNSQLLKENPAEYISTLFSKYILSLKQMRAGIRQFGLINCHLVDFRPINRKIEHIQLFGFHEKIKPRKQAKNKPFSFFFCRNTKLNYNSKVKAALLG